MIAAIALLGFAGITASTASAANETVSSNIAITPKGTLYKEAFRPVDLSLTATVTPGPGETKLRELTNVKFTLPKDFTFSTNGTQVCTKDVGQINPENANKPTAAVVAECPNSVVADGTATINVAGLVAAPITDPVLTLFNGGKDANGNPVLFIQGYSATVLPGGHGVPMKATLKDGTLDVAVPTLAANSAVSTFTINFPGATGQDPNYAQSKCSTGAWTASAVLTLGLYDPNTGTYQNENLPSAPSEMTCDGQAGKGAFSAPKVKGPKSVKKGKKGTYKVTVKNTGTAIAKGVKIAASGKGASGKASGG
ncbi:MAG TPA: hypothetical protein VMF31_01395, partial [Solirubrobacterales bacterium]|nr:hypothetical protein [Solirubrobacterales bacterium]